MELLLNEISFNYFAKYKYASQHCYKRNVVKTQYMEEIDCLEMLVLMVVIVRLK